MLDITKDIHSLTTFRRRSGDLMKQLHKSKRPVVLTVKGQAAAVVQDAEAYQRLLHLVLAELRTEKHIVAAVPRGAELGTKQRRRPDRGAVVGGGRLREELFERCLPQDATIHYMSARLRRHNPANSPLPRWE